MLKKNKCFYVMSSAFPIILVLVSFGLVVLGLRELIKELSVAYKRKLA